MSKAVLISIRPKWCEKIVNGEKTVEVRKTRPKLNTPLNHAPNDVEQQACLTREEIVRYLKGVGYGWHISDLKIYDTPRELGELRRACPNSFYCESCAMYRENDGTCGNESLQIKRPPQSWCYVEEM